MEYRNNRSSSGVSSGSCTGDYIPEKDDSLKDISYDWGSYLAIKRNRKKTKSIKSNIKSKIGQENASKEAKLNSSTRFNGASEEDSAFCPEITLQRNLDSNDHTGEKVYDITALQTQIFFRSFCLDYIIFDNLFNF